MTLKEKIVQDIESTPIILYMKGTKERPSCRFFSAHVVSMINSHSVVYQDINVIDPEIQGTIIRAFQLVYHSSAFCKR